MVRSPTPCLGVLAWRIDAYVWVLIPTILVAGAALRYTLPIIEIPVLGTQAAEAKWIRKWYRPGTLSVQDGEVTWREGRYRAYVNKAHIARRGLFGYGITVPVERNVSEGDLEITYDTADVPAYRSRTLNRRLQQEVQERIIQEHKALGELEP